MPIWLRKFTFLQMKEFYEEMQKEQEKAANKTKLENTGKKIAKPGIQKPTYTAKAPKK